MNAKMIQDLAGHLTSALANKGISIGFLDAAVIIKSLVTKLSSRSKEKS